MDRLPPLTALRAFEAAARHLSFAQAAAELNVTPAALSYQIKALEGHAGTPLFRRLNRAVELTEAGRVLAPGLADGFERLQQAWSQMRRLSNDSVLTVTAGPAFTAKWLAPRLFRFAEEHPEIELRFAATLRILDFGRDEVDIAIRFGLTVPDTLFAEDLAPEWVTPVMTPDLAARYDRLSSLAGAKLIHDDSLLAFVGAPDWAAWFRATGLSAPPEGGPRFSQADHALDYALEGGGVLLGRAWLAERDLAAGRLVAPFSRALQAPARYRIVCEAGTQTRPHIARFRRWVQTEMASLSAFGGGFDIEPARPSV
ncbi:MAG: transcriptional regulator GcvA [Pseudomonadota bacterium]